MYFFPSHLFTFHSLVQLLLPMVKLSRIGQQISMEYMYMILHVSPFYPNAISDKGGMIVNEHFSALSLLFYILTNLVISSLR